MTMSWHMMVEFEPPLVACVVSNANHSFIALRATKECVIAIPAVELAPKVVGIPNCSGRDVDKFERFGMTPAPAQHVSPPLVAECFANFECKVVDTPSSALWASFGSAMLRCLQNSTRESRMP
jgi:flavin reductase (DIM6/NTAB) family NADH-FMN oxidoreductase RutF